jgi:hypothetical protein
VNTAPRRFAASIAVALAAAHLAATVGPPDGEPVPFETRAIVADTTGIDLVQGHILRVASADDVEALRALLDAGSADDTMAGRVVAAIGHVPAGTVVLIGIIDQSCTPATEAGLVRGTDGELRMFAPGHVPEPIECFAANTTVAILSVAAADAPPGSADGARLVEFRFVGNQPTAGSATAVDLTADAGELATVLPPGAEMPVLPAVAKGARRVAFVQSGCQLASAELWATRAALTAHFEQADPHGEILCAVAEFYLAVFDIPAALLPHDVEIAGSIVG